MIVVTETWAGNVQALKKEPSFHENKTTNCYSYARESEVYQRPTGSASFPG